MMARIWRRMPKAKASDTGVMMIEHDLAIASCRNVEGQGRQQNLRWRYCQLEQMGSVICTIFFHTGHESLRLRWH